MDSAPDKQALDWAATAIGSGATVVSVESLHGGHSPWLLHIEHQGRAREAILRERTPDRIVSPFHLPTGAAALQVAEEHGLTTPRLLAADLDGHAAGVPATLETVVPGSSASPATVSPGRLHTAGAAIAKVHKVPLEPRPDLPLRIRSLQGTARLDIHALERRWTAVYKAAADRDKPNVITELAALTGWTAERARQTMVGTHSTPLLQRADDTLRAIPRPQGKTVLVHADLWAGNMIWDGDANVTLIDWKDAGVGQPGIDLGHLRMKMAIQYGTDAAAHVLDGWQQEMELEAADVPYWDLVSAVHTPAEIVDWESGFDDEGNQISSVARTERRDLFLRNALAQLEPELALLRHLVININD